MKTQHNKDSGNPLISVVIPAYNEEASLAVCLESVLAQNLSAGELEVIVVDNASTDRTSEVVMSFPGIRLVNEPRKGLLFARQAGFLASKGKFIVQLDADSFLAADWIQNVLFEFEKNPKLIGLSGSVVFFDLPAMSKIFVRFFYFSAYLSYLFNRFVLRVSSMVQGSNLMVRRDALEKIGGYDTSIGFYGEDTDLARRLHSVGPVEFKLKYPVYTSGRRLRSQGLSKTTYLYLSNYFSVILFKKPFTKTSTDIRTEQLPVLVEQNPKFLLLLPWIKTFLISLLMLGLTSYLFADGSLVKQAQAMERKSDLSMDQSIHNTILVAKTKIDRIENTLDPDNQP